MLGITFDSKLKWKEQVAKAINGSNSCLHGIRIIRKYFGPDEIRNLLTALFFSKLYYGAEIWHLPGLSLMLHKSIKFASANASKLCLNGPDLHLATHTEIHNRAKRAKPAQMILYKHAIMAYKLFRQIMCEDEFVQLNFQFSDNARCNKLNFIKRQRYEVGKNILLNRMCILNNRIEKSWLTLSIDCYKIHCKRLFLSTI